MSLINFPNVPNVPGVPALLRTATIPTAGALLNKVIGKVSEELFGKESWGLYLVNGFKLLDPSVFLSISFKDNCKVSSFPQEVGNFSSYNKVETPYDCRIKIAISEDKAARHKILDMLFDLKKSCATYSIITPEYTYLNATLQNYDYQRSAANGCRMIIADLWLLEVRAPELEPKKTTPKQPQAAEAVSQGQVQTQSYKNPIGGSGSAWSDWKVV